MSTRLRLLLRALARPCGPAVAAALAFASPAAFAQAESATVLAPGDVVRITVVGKPEMSGEFEVQGDSTIAHPYFRQVRVAGAPLPEVERRVGDYLRGYETNPQFLVEPLFRVSVTGEVRRPDLLVVRPEVTVLQALARAGGTTERGRLDRVHLVRRGVDRVLDLTRPELGEAQLTVRSGDQIWVERRVSVFRDYVAPAGSVVAALASVARLFMR
jgi:polysaccharide export outer membrane protein